MSRTKTALREHLRTPQEGTAAEIECRQQMAALTSLHRQVEDVRISLEESAASLRISIRILRSFARQRRSHV